MVTRYIRSGDLPTINGDNRFVDAFGRLRVSQPVNLWTSEFQYNLHPLYFDKITAVNGAVTHLPNESAASLAVTADNGSKAALQTFEYLHYQPGKSQAIEMTFIADVLDSTTIKVVRRTKTSGSVIDNKTVQADWNTDRLNGVDQSKVTLDITKEQILHIDFQWLSGGRIRYGFVIDGLLHYIHEDDGTNVLDVPITSTANLPVCWEIVTDATHTTMRIGYFDDDNGFFIEIQGTAAIKTLTGICCSVYSEGGDDEELGHVFAGGNGKILRGGIGATTPVPICSIRPATTLNSIVNRIKFKLESVEIFADDAMFWQLIYAPTSITSASFSSPVTHSSVEVDIAGTAIVGGIVIYSGYIPTTNKGGALGKDLRTKFPFTLDAAGTNQSRSLSLVVVTLGGTNKSAAGQFNWVEIR